MTIGTVTFFIPSTDRRKWKASGKPHTHTHTHTNHIPSPERSLFFPLVALTQESMHRVAQPVWNSLTPNETPHHTAAAYHQASSTNSNSNSNNNARVCQPRSSALTQGTEGPVQSPKPTQSQAGFRHEHITITAAISVTNYIITALND